MSRKRRTLSFFFSASVTWKARTSTRAVSGPRGPPQLLRPQDIVGAIVLDFVIYLNVNKSEFQL